MKKKTQQNTIKITKKPPCSRKTDIFAPKTQFFSLKTKCTAGLKMPAKKNTNIKP